jgi:hypothetical protein
VKKLFIVSVSVIILSGCATPARVDQMAVSVPVYQTNSALKDSIGVADVTGGRDTNPMWTSQVSSNDFRRALEASLQNAGLYSRIGAGSKYQLTADLTRLDQPLMGFDMTVTASVRYSLIERVSRKEVYSRVIQVPYTAKMSDAFIGSERLRLANEGAIKVNIQAFINDMLGLRLADSR